MLNEIFKGMDNAAEMIDENFESLKTEFGSNEDGHWIKFRDGTLICYFLDPVRELITESSGGVYYHNKWFDFPMPFVDFPTVSPAIRRMLGGVVWGGNRQLEMGRVEMFLISNGSGGDARHGYIAIGRWK